MAEIVEYKVEQTINELEQLEKVGLLSKDQIKLIIKKRKAFEYRLQRQSKLKEEYLKYITYEDSLLQLIKIRRNKLGYHGKHNEIDQAIERRIMSMFRRVCDKHQGDINLWFSFISFCKKMKNSGQVSAIFTRMLQVHNKNQSVWISAAKWEFEENLSPETARRLLQTALRYHSDSKLLWHEYFRMELMYCDKLRKRKGVLELIGSKDDGGEGHDGQHEVTEAVLAGKVAIIVYQNAIAAFEDERDLDFSIGFASICDDFDPSLTKAHKDVIYEDVKARFNDKEAAWDFISRRIIMDAKCEAKYNDKMDKEEKKMLMKECRQKAVDLFEEMVVTFNNELMFTFYIKFNLENLSKAKSEMKVKIILKKVLTLMERAWKLKLLSMEMFQEWILLLNQCSDNNNEMNKLHGLLLESMERWNDIDLWLFSLNIIINLDMILSKNETKRLFERGIKLFACVSTASNIDCDKLINLWDLYLIWANKNALPIEVLNISERAGKLSGDIKLKKIAEYFKPKCLQFQLQFNIERARKYYEAHKFEQPVVLAFFNTMIDIEEKQEPIDVALIRRVMNDRVIKFGRSDASLWIQMIKFELKHCVTNVSDIYNQAIKSLVPIECDKFVSQYALLRVGFN